MFPFLYIGSSANSATDHEAMVRWQGYAREHRSKDAVNNLGRLTVLMAESRLLELEITAGTFGAVFSEKQRTIMNQQIEELRRLTTSEMVIEPHSDDKPQ